MGPRNMGDGDDGHVREKRESRPFEDRRVAGIAEADFQSDADDAE